jgi:DNA helicase IV
MENRPQTAEIPAAARAIIAEEEAFALRVRTELLLAMQPSRDAKTEEADLEDRLRALRDEATSARADDLSTIFDQLHTLRAVAERPQVPNLPDLDAPYFAHLQLEENGKTKDYLLGRSTFIPTGTGIRIVDWRHAPIARIFYLYREGDEYEEKLPGRVARGEVTARRVLIFREGRLIGIITPDFHLDWRNGTWHATAPGERPALSGGEGSAVRAAPDVTALLDKEQYAALESFGWSPLLINGGAGSGKTTVALHRASSLTYKDKGRFQQKKMRVIVPEEGLARLTNRMLGWLGTPNVKAQTFTRFAHEILAEAAPKLPREICEETPTSVSRLKQHPELLKALPEWVDKHPKVRLNLAQDRADLFTDRPFLEEVFARAKGAIPKGAVLDTVRHTLRQLAHSTEEELAGVDEERLTTLDGLGLDERTSDDVHQTIDEEDAAVLLEIARLRTENQTLRRPELGYPLPIFEHLVIDEAQEYSAVELSVLGGVLASDKSMTMAGDEAQHMDTFTALSGWEERLNFLGVPEAGNQELKISYRSSRAVAEFAHAILGPLAPPEPPNAKRQGAPVARFAFPSEGELALFLTDQLQDLIAREPDASVAVLTRTPEGAKMVAGLLEHVPEARLVQDGEFSFKPGIDVAEVGAARGLEFDYVVIPDADAKNYPDIAEARRAMHVASTRAIHQLWVISTGKPSPILPPE